MNPNFSRKLNKNHFRLARFAFVLVSLFIILLLSYSNSFNCAWQFDDFDNIVNNKDIQISNFSFESINKCFHGIIQTGRWSRPLAYFSFALNYRTNGLDVFGYHVFNFVIHYLTSLFLFLFIYNTLHLSALNFSQKKHSYSISLLATFLWALSPVNVTSVTYIVQRMASMAGLFYIMTLYFYLKGRTTDRISRRLFNLVTCCLCAVLAFGTKENTAILPITIYLYDLIILQGVTKENLKKSWRYGLLSVLIFIFIGLLYTDMTALVGGYDGFRPFTMGERLLTQPRVLLYYISLLLYPVTSRLTLIHEFPISKSLLDPWTTLPALLAIMLIICGALYVARRAPLIAFCIIYFFLNHLIEGSFISLELVYEHRNYIPAMLFFVLPSLGIVKLMDTYHDKKKSIFYLVCFSVVLIIIIQGVTVRIQNAFFRDGVTLWRDNIEKMPHSQRAHQNLGHSLLLAGRLPESFHELQKALASKTTNQIFIEHYTYITLGEYYILMNDDDKALSYIDKALKRFPDYAALLNRKAEILLRKNNLEESQKLFIRAISLNARPLFYVNLGELLLSSRKPDAAIRTAQEALKRNGEVSKAYLIIAAAYKEKNNDYVSAHFRKLGNAPHLYP